MRKALAIFLLCATPARAADFALNFGAIEVIAFPDRQHAGFYPYLGGSVAFAAPRALLIVSLAIEVSFDQGRGGLVAGFTADFPINDRLGFDLNLFVIHDMPKVFFAESLFFLGGGPGLSIYLGKWTLSPSLSAFLGLNAPGWSLVPGFNVARTF